MDYPSGLVRVKSHIEQHLAGQRRVELAKRGHHLEPVAPMHVEPEKGISRSHVGVSQTVYSSVRLRKNVGVDDYRDLVGVPDELPHQERIADVLDMHILNAARQVLLPTPLCLGEILGRTANWNLVDVVSNQAQGEAAVQWHRLASVMQGHFTARRVLDDPDLGIGCIRLNEIRHAHGSLGVRSKRKR